jgi:hypothetical protein
MTKPQKQVKQNFDYKDMNRCFYEGKESMKSDILKEIDRIEMGDWDCHQPCGCANENTRICKLCGNNMEKSSDNRRLEELKQSIQQIDNPQDKPKKEVGSLSNQNKPIGMTSAIALRKDKPVGDVAVFTDRAQSEQNTPSGLTASRKGCSFGSDKFRNKMYCDECKIKCPFESKPLGCGTKSKGGVFKCGERMSNYSCYLCPSCSKPKKGCGFIDDCKDCPYPCQKQEKK